MDVEMGVGKEEGRRGEGRGDAAFGIQHHKWNILLKRIQTWEGVGG